MMDFKIKILIMILNLFVLIKNWIGNGQLIPAGPLREKLSSLKKYDAVFLNGISNNIENIEKKLKI